MPHPGDQHRANGNLTANPYEEQKRSISEYTAQEIATLQSRLNKRLGPEFISTRPGPGNQKIAYLSAEKAINLANEVFGFNGWNSSIQQIDVDFVEENPNSGKVSLGLSVIVRVTLRDGTYHEDIGYGGVENCKGKAMAFEKSKKEATTDALKRALRNFGNVLGNCMYDRAFITEVSKVKPGQGTKFDVNELHRHADFAPKPATATMNRPGLPPPPTAPQGPTGIARTGLDDSFDMGEFDDADFDEGEFGHPDEVLIPADVARSSAATPSKAPSSRALPPPAASATTAQLHPNMQPHPAQVVPSSHRSHSATSHHPPAHQPAQVPLPGQAAAVAPGAVIRPAGFYSAKAAPNIDQNNISSLPVNTILFNPHAESPSIRKTVGVDHNKSIPVKRDTLKADAAGGPKDFLDPKGDTNRKIGMPGSHVSNGGRGGPSTSSYRPPTRHGTPTALNVANQNEMTGSGTEKLLTAAKRPPLADVSNGQRNTTAMTIDGADAKRQKLSGPETSTEVKMANGIEKT